MHSKYKMNNPPSAIPDIEIFRWLNKQNYQTDYDEFHEYKMYYELDLPKIIKDWLKHLEEMEQGERSCGNCVNSYAPGSYDDCKPCINFDGVIKEE